MGKRNSSHFLCPRTAEKLVAETIKQTHGGICLSVPSLLPLCLHERHVLHKGHLLFPEVVSDGRVHGTHKSHQGCLQDGAGT